VVCTQEVKANDQAVQCEVNCMFWFHISCVNLSDEDYEHLCSCWQCTSCKKDLPEFNSKDAVNVFHFNFQENLPTPKSTAGKQFYLRLLWTYLFGIYSASTKIITAMMWHKMLGM